MKKRNIITPLLFIASAEAVGGLSALLAGGHSDFFNTYKEPPLLPPPWVFPVAWSVLYALMGLSAYWIYKADAPQSEKKTAFILYAVQLALNFSWSIIFFRFEALWLAFAVLLALTAAVALMMLSFYKIRPAAAYINIPYFIWLLFAGYLNLATAVIN